MHPLKTIAWRLRSGQAATYQPRQAVKQLRKKHIRQVLQAGLTSNSYTLRTAPAPISPFIGEPEADQQGEVLVLSGHCDKVIRRVADR